MTDDAPDIDPRLVEIDNALDRHERARKNSVEPKRLQRASAQLKAALHEAAEDDAAVDEYLEDRREPE